MKWACDMKTHTEVLDLSVPVVDTALLHQASAAAAEATALLLLLASEVVGATAHRLQDGGAEAVVRAIHLEVRLEEDSGAEDMDLLHLA